jgi:hypothetical protein
MSFLTFLVEYEIKSHAILEQSSDSLKFQHPTKNVSIEIRNKKVTSDSYEAILSAYVVLESDSFETVEEESLDHLKEFIDMLTLSTNMHFSIGNLLRIADWSPGIEERKGIIFKKFPGDDRPYAILDNTLLETIEILASSNITSRLRRAMRWFSNGVSATYLEDKFQCFWFVVEILSQEVKPTEKVNDSCAICKKPLYCQHCDTYPTHKPYPKQAIEHLFSLFVNDDNGNTFNMLNEFRNALMHGDRIEKVEKRLNLEFSKQVDLLGKIAWISILNILRKTISKNSKNTRLGLIETNTYCEHEMQMKINITFKSKDLDNPCISEIPKLNVERTRSN